MEARIIVDTSENAAVIQIGEWAHKYALGDVAGIKKAVRLWWHLHAGTNPANAEEFYSVCRAFFHEAPADNEEDAREYQPGPGVMTMGLSNEITMADYGFACLMDKAIDDSVTARRRGSV